MTWDDFLRQKPIKNNKQKGNEQNKALMIKME